ncbi:MAG: hypothetical protein ACPLKP_00615 [Microgenomates group bacterium]
MVNQASNLPSNIQYLLKIYSFWLEEKEKEKEEPKIKAQKGIEIFAFIYERIRNALDYKKENLLRKYAIERIVKRQLWLNSYQNTEQVAEILIKELIWSRYLKNEEIPLKKIEEIKLVINQFIPLLKIKKESDWQDWVYNLMACEIENIISFNPIPFAFVEIIQNWFKRNFILNEPSLSEKEKDIQIFIAICRSFLKVDNPTLGWYLIKKYYPSVIQKKEDHLLVKNEIEKQLSHPIGLPLFRFIRPLTVRFLILKEIIEKNLPHPEEILNQKEKLKEEIEEICQEKYFQIKDAVKRGITRSIIYIFITKVLLALILEIPYDLFFFKKLNLLPLTINTIIPPFLMFGIGLRIKIPSEKNTEKIIRDIIDLFSSKTEEEPQEINLSPNKANKNLRKIFLGIYGLLFVFIFSLITYILLKIGFSFLGLIIFFFFLSLVLLFGFRVQYNASEILVIENNEGVFYKLIDNLSLPFLSLGVWLNKYVSKLNFLMIIMDFLIEAPLKSIINVVEEWLDFIQEKKKEVVEVPI